MSVGARNHDIAAISTLVPFTDITEASAKVGILQRAAALAVGSLGSSFSKLSGIPINIPIVGKPGELAFLTFPGWYDNILESIPETSNWQNSMPIETITEILSYEPYKSAHGINCPVLMIYGSRDKGISETSIMKTAGRIKDVTVEKWPINHFDPFSKEHGPKIAAKQIEFFKSKVLA